MIDKITALITIPILLSLSAVTLFFDLCILLVSKLLNLESTTDKTKPEPEPIIIVPGQSNHFPGGYHAYLRSPQWRIIRSIVVLRDHGKCTSCRSPYNLEVHHLTYSHKYFEHENNLLDLTLLCHTCHQKEHNK